MVIPDCNSGILRQGLGGVRDEDGFQSIFRGCEKSNIMNNYKHVDMIMSDEDNNCKVLFDTAR